MHPSLPCPALRCSSRFCSPLSSRCCCCWRCCCFIAAGWQLRRFCLALGETTQQRTTTNYHGIIHADSEMAGRHRCRPRSIQIIRTGIVAAKDTKRPDVQQFHVSSYGRLCTLLPVYYYIIILGSFWLQGFVFYLSPMFLQVGSKERAGEISRCPLTV